MNRIAKAIGCGFGYGLGIARNNPEKFLEQSDHHDEVDDTGDKIMKDLGDL